MASYVRFVEDSIPGRKTRVFDVFSLRDVYLGTIRWHGAWRQYIFEPAASTIWSIGCLADVSAWIKALMDARRG